jgi:hypothetical protein
MILHSLECRFLTIALCDAAEPWQLGSQDAATPIMQGIIDLHHDILFFLILILVFVSWMLVRALWHFHEKKNPIPQRIVHGTTIEIIRTIFPSIIPIFIAIPSFAQLYSMDLISLAGSAPAEVPARLIDLNGPPEVPARLIDLNAPPEEPFDFHFPPAPDPHPPVELPPLTQRQENSLARALNYQALLREHVQRIFWENGRELTPDESSYFRDLLIADLDTELNLRKLRERAQQLIKYGARAKAFKKAKRVFDNEDI